MRSIRTEELLGDIALCIGFYTRLPVQLSQGAERDFARAQWAAPVAGIVVGLLGGIAYWVSNRFGLPATVSAALALGVTLAVTGALHEDGLGDTADGFGGGKTRERKLEIMHDSRIGTYAAAALLFSILLRWSAIAALATPSQIFLALIAAHAAARAAMPIFMHFVPPARTDGLSANAGRVPDQTALLAGALGFVALLPLGFVSAIWAAAGLSLVLFLMKRLCEIQIGGQTGDTLGAVEQLSEIIVLLIACAILT